MTTQQDEQRRGRHASHERLRKAVKLVRLARRGSWRNGLRHRVAREIEVATARLDEAIDDAEIARPALAKIDVQGQNSSSKPRMKVRDHLACERLTLLELHERSLQQDFVKAIEDPLCPAQKLLAGVFGLKRDRAGRCLQADLLFSRSAGGPR